MMVLKITDFDDKPIGEMWLSSDYQVQYEVHDPIYKSHLADLVSRLSTKPVPLRIGRRVEKEGSRSFITQFKECRPIDPEFLWAVRDQVNRLRWEGRRLYGHLVNESDKGGKANGK